MLSPTAHRHDWILGDSCIFYYFPLMFSFLFFSFVLESPYLAYPFFTHICTHTFFKALFHPISLSGVSVFLYQPVWSIFFFYFALVPWIEIPFLSTVMSGLSAIVLNDITARATKKGCGGLWHLGHVTLEIGKFSSLFTHHFFLLWTFLSCTSSF